MGRLGGVLASDIINLAEHLYHETVDTLMRNRVSRGDASRVAGAVQNSVEGLLDYV